MHWKVCPPSPGLCFLGPNICSAVVEKGFYIFPLILRRTLADGRVGGEMTLERVAEL